MKKTWKPITGGICSIVAGAWGVVVGGLFSLVGLGGAMFMEIPRSGLFAMAAIGWPAVVLGLLAIVGGVMAVQRRRWGLSLAGAICALLIPPPFILGILAIVFIALSRDEFLGRGGIA